MTIGLALSVLFLDAFNFVHKSIGPENVIIFRSGKAKLGKPYLVGFEKFRLCCRHDGNTPYWDDLWEKNLHRHPQRQGVRPQEHFVMQHDVYSLGIVLELGVSMSFLQWPNGPCEKPIPNPELEFSDLGPQKKTQYGKANAIKEKLVTLVATKLPNTFRRKYTEVVLSSLICLDKGNNNFGDSKESEDNHGILVGVRYIEKILTLLDDISV